MSRFFTLCFLLLNICAPAQQQVIDSIQQLIREAPSTDEALSQKAVLVLKYFVAGKPGESSKLLKQAMAEAAKGASDKALGNLYKSAGTLHFYEHRLDSALACYEIAHKYLERAGDKVGVIKSLCNIGNIYGMQGDVEKALDYYRKALLLEEQAGFTEGAHVPLNNIAVLYRRLNISGKALDYFRKAEKANMANGSLYQLSTSYDGLARIYNDLGKFDSAMVYARKAGDLALKIGDMSGYAYALTNLGSVHNALKQHDSARYWLKQSLPYSRMVNDKRLEFSALANIAASLIQQNNTDSALLYVEQAMPMREQLNLRDYDKDLAKILAEYYFRKGEFREAYGHLMTHATLRDSSYAIDINQRIADMQEKYETQKKDRENRFLEAENNNIRASRNYLLVILVLAIISIIGGVLAFMKIKKANRVINRQKALVEEKQKEILDSINYARRIQFALISSGRLLENNLPEHFVLFKPKAVVSGDFYWASLTNEGFMLIAGDCTGHGVPGAFMSLLNITKLSQVINEQKITRPDLVLNKVREEIIQVLNPEDSNEESRDGMDATLCRLNLSALKLDFSAANNSLYIVRNKKILVHKADKMPVGKGHDDTIPFSNNEVFLEKDDRIYMFTDGFADQFGGPLGKKFKYKQLEKLLLNISHQNMQTQKQLLEEAFEQWRGDQEQVDDVCLIGIRV